MPLVIQTDWYTKAQVRSNPETIFVFGDNLARKGTGGQAKACRDEPNTIGIVTKWDEKRNPGSYMYDTTLTLHRGVISSGFYEVESALRDGKTVVFPADGVGTGLANLAQNAPQTLDFINRWVERIKLYDEQLRNESALETIRKETGDRYAR